MISLFLESASVGIAFVVLVPVGVVVGLIVATAYMRKTYGLESDEVGWDLVTMTHNHPLLSILIPLGVFLFGSSIGYRVFSK